MPAGREVEEGREALGSEAKAKILRLQFNPRRCTLVV